jgi:hypothetical protein
VTAAGELGLDRTKTRLEAEAARLDRLRRMQPADPGFPVLIQPAGELGVQHQFRWTTGTQVRELLAIVCVLCSRYT